MPGKPAETANLFSQGIRSFNQRDFYEAHEYFEAAWRRTTENSREFYRALLHLSGGFFRLTQNRPKAARKFFTHALAWLDQFPDTFMELDNFTLQQRLIHMIDAIDQQVNAEILIENYAYLLKSGED